MKKKKRMRLCYRIRDSPFFISRVSEGNFNDGRVRFGRRTAGGNSNHPDHL